jgi:hypothetical protein
MTALAAKHITHPAGCSHLAGQCIETDAHCLHWGHDNTIPAIRGTYAIASAQLFSTEDGAPESEPCISVSFAPFDGDLTLAELDQLIAGTRDFLAGLEQQAVQLAAARRQWEAQQ